jgi:hypothetical protein
MTAFFYGTELGLAPFVRRSRTETKIEDFASLPVGWHYGQGGPISSPVISTAKELCEFLVLIGFTRTNAFAGADGEILLTAYHEDHYVATIIEPNLEISVTHEHGRAEVFSAETMDVKGAKRALRNSAEEIWSSSGSFIPGISIGSAEDSTTWRLRNPRMAECQFSRSSALRLTAA